MTGTVIWRRDVRWAPGSGDGPALLRIAHERWGPGFACTGRGHPCTLLLLRAGRGWLEAEGRSWRLGPGWTCGFVAGTLYRYGCTGPEPLELVLLRLHGAAADASLRRACGGEVFAQRCCDDGRLDRLLGLLVDIGCGGGLDAQGISDRLLPALFACLSSALPARRVTAAERTWQRAKAWLDQRSATPASPAGAARACGVGQAHLSRLFARYAGCPPGRYLLNLRLRRAADRLLEPGAAIATVAAEAGFSDRYAFAKAFRRVLGVPPGVWRERAGGAG